MNLVEAIASPAGARVLDWGKVWPLSAGGDRCKDLRGLCIDRISLSPFSGHPNTPLAKVRAAMQRHRLCSESQVLEYLGTA
jgi:hypothetical protein